MCRRRRAAAAAAGRCDQVMPRPVAALAAGRAPSCHGRSVARRAAGALMFRGRSLRGVSCGQGRNRPAACPAAHGCGPPRGSSSSRALILALPHFGHCRCPRRRLPARRRSLLPPWAVASGLLYYYNSNSSPKESRQRLTVYFGLCVCVTQYCPTSRIAVTQL